MQINNLALLTLIYFVLPSLQGKTAMLKLVYFVLPSLQGEARVFQSYYSVVSNNKQVIELTLDTLVIRSIVFRRSNSKCEKL